MAALRPPPRMSLSDWLQNSVRLPSDVAAVPGPLRLWKPQQEIADAIGDPDIERVTVVKPVRVGFTTLLTGAIGNFVANDPAPIMVLLPTEADARDYMVSDIEPVFGASPVLRDLLQADNAEGGRNTLLHRRFPAGSLKIVAAKAPRNLRRHNVRVLFGDEVDAMEAGPEGSPIALGERRTLSFPNRKIVLGSTPIFEEGSNILQAYGSSDQRVFEVPCPECGAFHEIQWRDITWPENRPDLARYVCPSCKSEVDERHKAAMVVQGQWRPQCPEVVGHAGFRLNALVSTLANATWGKLAVEFLTVRDDPSRLQTFVNTILAQGWRESVAEVDEAGIAGRAEDFGLNAIPVEVLAITCGVDVQDDRLEVSIVGWTRAEEVLVLAHEVIWGSPDDDTTWAELDELLRSAWAHPLGGKIRIDGAVIDSGDGDWTDRVYSFAFPRLQRRVMAGKGVGGSRPAIEMSKSKVKGGRLFIIGVDGIKTTIINRLSRGSLVRFSNSLPPSYYEQLASERKVLRYVRGQPHRRFERKPGARAEALDCLVYAMAARHAVPIVWDQREARLKCEPEPKRGGDIIRSSWMGPR